MYDTNPLLFMKMMTVSSKMARWNAFGGYGSVVHGVKM